MPDKVPKDAEQRAAESAVDAFEQDLGPFVVAADTTRMPMVFTDAREPDHPIIFANDSFLKLSGYDRDEVLAQPFTFILPSGPTAAREQIAKGFAGDGDDIPDVCARRKDGSTFWTSLFISPVRDGNGAIVQHFVSLVDESRHHSASAHAEMLIDELNHRVKNSNPPVGTALPRAGDRVT